MAGLSVPYACSQGHGQEGATQALSNTGRGETPPSGHQLRRPVAGSGLSGRVGSVLALGHN